MRGLAGFVLIGSIAAFAGCGVMLADLSLAVGEQAAQKPQIGQSVDRSSKSDRLEPETHIGREPVPNAKNEALAGCDLVFSPLMPTAKNPPGRCVT